jgi:hypothetical protein
VWTINFEILVPLPLLFAFQCRLMLDDEFLAGYSEFNPNVKRITMPMMPMRRFDNHAAACDAVEIPVEFVRFLLDSCSHSRR